MADRASFDSLRLSLLSLLSLLLGTVLGCGSDASPPSDLGTPPDMSIPADAGSRIDAGSETDGAIPGDAGTQADVGASEDVGPLPAVCGDGMLHADEACDDGNDAGGDGCADDCMSVQANYRCVEPGSLCEECGDGEVGLGETCDDANTDSDDGCSTTCDLEWGWNCRAPGEPCVALTCGDGVLALGEACDDGNSSPNDGCDANCEVEANYVCDAPGVLCRPVECGDFRIEGAEQCDDGNTAPSDGCDASCALETACGDSVVGGAEQCDDGNAGGGDGCSSACLVEPGYACESEGSPCTLIFCGDGLVEGAETCDDGGRCSGGGEGSDDGTTCVDDMDCDGICQRTSRCVGGIDDGLPCWDDDHCAAGGTCTDAAVMLGGDGCSAACEVEPFFECQGEPSLCAQVVSWVSIRQYSVSSLFPEAIHYDPATRSFVGYKASATSEPIDLCLDGSILDPQNNCVISPGGSTCETPAPAPALSSRIRPVAGGLAGATFDPIDSRWVFVNDVGSSAQVTVTDLAGATLGTDQIAATSPAGVAIGSDGRLYVGVSDDGGGVLVYDRVAVSTAHPTGFDFDALSSSPANAWAIATNAPGLQSLFAVGGFDILGAHVDPATEPLSGQVSFRFFRGDATLFGTSLMPGRLIENTQGYGVCAGGANAGAPCSPTGGCPDSTCEPQPVYSQAEPAVSSESASEGAGFLVCPGDSSEPCQLFALSCRDDGDCEARSPGTVCRTDALVPHCSRPAEAVDDNFRIEGGASTTSLDVLANDTRSESVCVDSSVLITAVTPASEGGEVAIRGDGGALQYTPPSDFCGGYERFSYTATLGGGEVRVGAVAVLVTCVCGDELVQLGEECDDGNAIDTDRCSNRCVVQAICGNDIIERGEQCDDGNVLPRDGCSDTCVLETICGNGALEAAEQCDDDNTTSGDGCSQFCVVEVCGDAIVQAGIGEQCDDGNAVSGDGCSDACLVE